MRMSEQVHSHTPPRSPSPLPVVDAQATVKRNNLKFDPSRMIDVVKRKALIRELAELYHAECLSCCQELLELQKRWKESYIEVTAEDTKKESTKPAKRPQKAR